MQKKSLFGFLLRLVIYLSGFDLLNVMMSLNIVLRTTLRELLCGIICLIKHRAIFKELSAMPAFVS